MRRWSLPQKYYLDILRTMDFRPLGNAALVASDFADPHEAASFAAALCKTKLDGVTEVFSAFNSVAVHFDPAHFSSASDLQHKLRSWIARSVDRNAVQQRFLEPKTVEIPVRYGGALGPDLAEVAAQLRMPATEVVRLHCGGDYRVLAVGFMPGFGYLGGLPEALKLPRRATPRTQVRAGSVGIGGPYTGVYPLNSPGGWQLIGHTNRVLFDPMSSTGALLRVGDVVRFVSICEGAK